MNWLLCEILFACVVSAEPMPLDELTYRTALFDYYQDDTQSALVDVLVAGSQDRTGENPLRFDLARGSFAFDQGMYRYAKATFDAIPAAELSPTDQLRLAFHRSRLNLQQQDWGALNATLEALAAAETALDAEPHPESTFMRSELALARADVETSAGLLATLDADDSWKAYGLFNLAVTRSNQGDAEGALATLLELDELEVVSEETADLKQRGRLAMAWLAGPADRAADAAAVLQDLPDSSRYRDSALAAYGNLAMSREDYALAARIWLTLKEDRRWMSSGAIARIGFPLALQKLQNPDNVLAHYRSAASEFEARLVVLKQVDERLQDTTWVRTLAQAVHGASRNSGVSLPLPPDDIGGELGNQDWLNWLAAEDVHRVLEEWQSLNDMAAWLNTLPRTLEAFAEVSTEQQRRTARLGQSLHADGLLERRARLAGDLQALEERLRTLDGKTPEPTLEWMGAFAADDERETLQELFALKAAAGSAPDADRAVLVARIDRLIGARFWLIADDLPARRWALQRELQGARRAIDELDRRIAVVQNAESNYVATVVPRFEEYRGRAMALLATVNAAMGDREQQIASLMRDRLHQETEQIGQYLFLTRVAIAEVSDRLASAEIETPGLEKRP